MVTGTGTGFVSIDRLGYDDGSEQQSWSVVVIVEDWKVAEVFDYLDIE